MIHILYILLLSFSFAVPSQAILPKVLFTHQSQDISALQWFEFFTLCFAPLVAHVAGGVASPTLLGGASQSPNWSARLPHFNPISIIWRYYAIADRRVRARAWDERDMAACNAVFWDGERGCWDGSEEIMVRSRAWITKVPEQKHVPILSASSVVTVVLTIQGLQAMFLIVSGLNPNGGYKFAQGLPNLFLPLACLAVGRLPAALWLSSDYGYLGAVEDGARQVHETHLEAGKLESPSVTDHLLGSAVSDRLCDAHSRKGIVYRIWWLASAGGFIGGSAAACTRLWWGYSPSVPYNSLSRLMFQAMYLGLTVSALLIYCFFVLRGNSRTTIIPCIHATWYKVFTILLIATALGCIVVSALETRILLNGTVTTLPELNCTAVASLCVPVGKGQGNSNV
jgi:hypothetical protein